ncbi:hypothetical protein FIBSPDRAFT_897426 [Athelia psychrophila]|uniref:Uncharacterized protein n=1 Tax=Athelia psychrophila TaxID=1759441 RepID=A0A166C857_9AGAM|nr:hypothetical protein FIBSPDRAFT_897426 [Fibularhizoctonia sp. CBS 109695]
MRTCQAFGPLIVLCSFAGATTPGFTNDTPRWIDCMSKNGGNTRRLQELQQTLIVNFSTQAGRIGVVIRPKGLFLEHLPRFLQANMAVWLLWNEAADYDGTKCSTYRPSAEAVAAAKSFSPKQPPEPERFSGQHGGESVHEFMARRAADNALRGQAETPEARAVRTQRTMAAEAYALPGKRGAKVFEWQKEGSHWICRAVPRGLVEKSWGDMVPGHLRYDLFANEWDHCELFDPSAKLPVDDEYDNLEYEYLHGLAAEQALHEAPHACPVAVAAERDDAPMGTTNLEQAYAPVANQGTFMQPELLDVILVSHYGFRGDPSLSVPYARSWTFARKTLSNTESLWLRPDLQDAVCRFVVSTIDSVVPPELCDLTPSSPSPNSYFSSHLLVECVANVYSSGGLGERHVNYKSDLGYERDRATFLPHHRACAALLEGGIMWCLAIEHLKFEDVVGGPVGLDSGLYERFDGEAAGGWDDNLTHDELDLICPNMRGVQDIYRSWSEVL